ncbi:unnamed protein product, partial [Rotaria sp. Silwood2]
FKKMKRTFNWRTTRKMTLQLISISSLYSIFWISCTIISIIHLCVIPKFLDKLMRYYFHYSPYFVQLLMPFICLACLPELWTRKNHIVPIS